MITIVAVLIAGIVLGYAARQRQDLIEARDQAEFLAVENADLSVKNRELQIAKANLSAENEELRNESHAYESVIQMVLREVDGQS